MQLGTWIAKTWRGEGAPLPESMQTHTAPEEPTRNRLDWSYRTAREHAEALLAHVHDRRSGYGLILCDEILELYAEMLQDHGWAPRSWAPVAHEFDAICTGGTKPYAWVIVRGGQKKRRRVYPIPSRAEVDLAG
jgi:hypothetical protein